MKIKLAGIIEIPTGSYKGCGEAILFLQKDNHGICDKVAYIYQDSEASEFESDEFHHPLKVMLSNWEAVIPSLQIYYTLVESK